MNDRPQLKELTEAMLIRRRLLESAKDDYDVADYDGVLRHVLQFLEHAQRNDESVVALYHECIGLTGYCAKVLERASAFGPITIPVPSPPSSEEKTK